MANVVLIIVCLVIVCIIIYSVLALPPKRAAPAPAVDVAKMRGSYVDALEPEHIHSMYRLFTS
ncbi:hypothetical pox protein [Squirrelpox virus]|uniref:Hypothetical pox protein n=1 Tax=Squirrelpox virus TaxID=240426 RepID=U3UBK2_9POXV|nr:hypothetical pox protein [Squirrelpox virus]CCD83284.1 hypothetical pox protein [Squirrelpox virus]